MTVWVVVARGFMSSDWVYAVFANKADAESFIAENREGLTLAVEEFEVQTGAAELRDQAEKLLRQRQYGEARQLAGDDFVDGWMQAEEAP